MDCVAASSWRRMMSLWCFDLLYVPENRADLHLRSKGFLPHQVFAVAIYMSGKNHQAGTCSSSMSSVRNEARSFA
ncbi:MAG: hypothetical protein MK160_08560 [Rhodobacteraceae bacterium]|nr:hypothetical protein [Paracoccaceae bacterium]